MRPSPLSGHCPGPCPQPSPCSHPLSHSDPYSRPATPWSPSPGTLSQSLAVPQCPGSQARPCHGPVPVPALSRPCPALPVPLCLLGRWEPALRGPGVGTKTHPLGQLRTGRRDSGRIHGDKSPQGSFGLGALTGQQLLCGSWWWGHSWDTGTRVPWPPLHLLQPLHSPPEPPASQPQDFPLLGGFPLPFVLAKPTGLGVGFPRPGGAGGAQSLQRSDPTAHARPQLLQVELPARPPC